MARVIFQGWEVFLIMLNPITPHLAEELWKIMGFDTTLCVQKWPLYDKSLSKQDFLTIAIQVNGKLKNTIKIDINDIQNKELIINEVKKVKNIKNLLDKKVPKNIIFIPGKVVNIVI